MQYYSTNNSSIFTSFRDAVIEGLTPDGGLYMPEQIPILPGDFFQKINTLSFPEIALEIASSFLLEDIPLQDLKKIIDQTFNFPVPIVELDTQTSILELFHGPTLAFKDFDARFLSHVLSYFVGTTNRKVTVLVATSGDTGTAVASAFYKIPHIDVVLLYPKGKVSATQEQMLNTWGENITALEVKGDFDDCQKMVKKAFLDNEVKNTRNLTSSNSINIARLLPQMFYYFYTYGKIKKPLVFSVPTGNLGNLIAGFFSKKMGLPVGTFIATANSNDAFPKYLTTGNYQPQSSKQTISNAMDVGNPSNFARVTNLYKNIEGLRNDVWSKSFSDDETKQTMKEVYKKYNYILDPHGAVAFAGLEAYRKENSSSNIGIVLETAHPAKFSSTAEETLGIKMDLPQEITDFAKKENKAIGISNSYEDFKTFLLAHL